MARLPLVVATLWFAGGIIVGVQRPVPEWGGPLLFPAAALGAMLAGAGMVGGRRGTARQTGHGGGPVGADAARMTLALLAVGGLLLGAASRRSFDRSCPRWIPEGVRLELVARTQAVQGDRLTLWADSVRVGGVAVPCAASLPARGDAGGARAGAPLVVQGRWWSPPGPSPRLRRAGAFLVDSVAPRPASAGEAAREPGEPREPWVERLRRSARTRVDTLFGDHAPLVASLLLAQRDALDRDVRERYARAGLSHLLAISGLHVGLVAGILLMLASVLRLSARPGAVAAAVGTLAYVAFLGAPHSAVRAAVQIVLVLAARMLQRPTRTAALMATAALVLLVWDPGAILTPGFQLSFAGVVGILVLRRALLGALRPLGRLRVARLRAGHWLADGLATSLAATLATAPIAAWHFGRLAPIGVVANLAAIPLLGLAVPALALPLALDPLWHAGAVFLSGPGTLLLGVLDRVAAAAAAVPGGAVSVTGPSALLWAGAVAVAWGAGLRLGRVRRKVRVAVRAGALVAVLALAPLRPAGDHLELHMIDVGQGDAFALRTPAGRWLLVDAGIGGRDYDAGERRVVPYLARHGARRIEGLVLTHPDADHVGGAGAVLRALRPLWVGDPAVVAGKGLYLSLLEAAADASVPWVGLERGVVMELDGVTLEFLYPEGAGASVEDANDASVVARVEYGDFAALLTGDAPAAVERRLVERYGRDLDADVLKVGHHGSSTSSTPELLTATGARLALVSAGRGNRYGHPHPVVVRRLREHGIRVLRSDRDGSVIVRADGRGGIQVETERGEGGT